jgi:DNA-binding response OmpR family regulator
MSEKPTRILIVDDEPNLLLALEFLFAQHGYQVGVVRSGEEALTAIPTFAPHVLLLEVRLPYRSGFEICQIVRGHSEWKSIRIILLTVKDREVEVAKGLAMGADAYITKPFSNRALLEKVDELMRART